MYVRNMTDRFRIHSINLILIRTEASMTIPPLKFTHFSRNRFSRQLHFNCLCNSDDSTAITLTWKQLNNSTSSNLEDCRPILSDHMTPLRSGQVQLFCEQPDIRFNCTEEACGKSFGRKKHLARHMRVRRNPLT